MVDRKRQRYQFDLAALQRLAAVNYAALEKLVLGLKTQQPQQIRVGRHLHFRLAVMERAKYTTEVRIEQHALSMQLPGLTEAQIDVRLYHDAQLAEVIRSQNISRLQARYEQPNQQMLHADEKFQVNQFLQEWIQLIRRAGRAPELASS